MFSSRSPLRLASNDGLVHFLELPARIRIHQFLLSTWPRPVLRDRLLLLLSRLSRGAPLLTSQAALERFVKAFEASGFRGGVNYYRCRARRGRERGPPNTRSSRCG